MNYRNLLIKYMKMIGDLEGTYFVGGRWSPNDNFTEEEWSELQSLAQSDPAPPFPS